MQHRESQLRGDLTRRAGFLSNRRRLQPVSLIAGDAIEWNSTVTEHNTCEAGWVRVQIIDLPLWLEY
jgi:hypothetical protein